jgi:hypothetical protein
LISSRLLCCCLLLGLNACGARISFAEREPWRREAEVSCLNSGAAFLSGAGHHEARPAGIPAARGWDRGLSLAIARDR